MLIIGKKFVITVMTLFARTALTETVFAQKIGAESTVKHAKGRYMTVEACYHPAANQANTGVIVSKGSIWSNAWFYGTEASYRVSLFDDKEAVLGFTQWRRHLACGKADPSCGSKIRFEESFQVNSTIASRVKKISIGQKTGQKTSSHGELSQEEKEAIETGAQILLELLSSTLSAPKNLPKLTQNGDKSLKEQRSSRIT